MKALIQNGGGTLLLDIPYRLADTAEDVGSQLASIGVRKTPSELLITDDGAITVKLIAENGIDKRLLSLIGPEDALSTVNTACSLLAETPQEIRDEVQRSIVQGAYRTVQEMLLGAQAMRDRQAQVIRITLRSDFLNACCEDDYILTLPKTDEQLRAARDRLGVKTFGECEIIQTDSPLRMLTKLDYHGDVSLMNGIARAVAKAVEQEDSGSLLFAVLEAFESADACELKEHIEHLDCYELLPKELCKEESYGERFFFQSPSAKHVGDEMIPYIDFEKYGMAMMEKNGVHAGDTGWLSPKVGGFKIYMPLTGRMEGSYYQSRLNGDSLTMYDDKIAGRIASDITEHLPPNGLIADSKLPDTIKNKVLSVLPTVEVRNDALWGCLQIAKVGWITESELSALCDEWYNQLKFGWGDHFRTQGIRCGDGSLYINFWHESNDYRFFSEKEMTELERQTGWLDDSFQTGGMRL